MLVLVHALGDGDQLQATVLNFSWHSISGSVMSEHLPPRAEVIDMLTDRWVATVDDLHSFPVLLEPYQGLCLAIIVPDEHDLNSDEASRSGLLGFGTSSAG
jgi:hypothetical protein